MGDKKIFYNLQICRGVAAFIVVLAHANLMLNKELFSGFLIIGWNGVDFFFVLSGFIIYFVNMKYSGLRNTFKEYIVKRLTRIYPAYWFYAVAVLILDCLVSRLTGKHLISWLDLNATSILKSLFLYPTNVDSGVWPIIPAAWTLSYELFFYMVFGSVILFNKKTFLAIVCLWLLLIILNSINFISSGNNSFLNMVLNTKNIEFLFGCLIAELTLTNKISMPKNNAVILLFFGVFLLFISWSNEALSHIWFKKMDFVNFGIPYFMIICALIALETSKVESKIKKSLVYIGDASYSIYLTHYIGIIIFSLITSKLHFKGYFQFFTVIVLLTVIGCLCYSFIEKPITKFFLKKVGAKQFGVS